MLQDSQESMRTNIQSIGKLLRSSLGPLGANKLTVQQTGEVTTTSVGSLFLDRLDLESPEVKLLKRGSQNFRSEHQDGSTSVLSLTVDLLDEAESLFQRGLHPTTIANGYKKALATGHQYIDRHSQPLDEVGVKPVARTALTGTDDIFMREKMAEFLEQVWTNLSETHEGDGEVFGRNRLGVVSRLGGTYAESELVDGVVLDARPVNDNMPRNLGETRVLLLSSTVDIKGIQRGVDRKNVSFKLNVNSLDDRDAIGDWENNEFRERLRDAVALGCGVIVTRRAINEQVESVLANHGILAIHDIDKREMERVSELTSALVVPELSHITENNLGTARVYVDRKAGRDMTIFEPPDRGSIYTLLCRGPDARMVDAFEDSVKSAISAVRAAEHGDGIVPGGGAVEIGASQSILATAPTYDSREQLAIESFANSLQTIPRALSRNVGLGGADSVARLISAHYQGSDRVGIDATSGELRNMLHDESIVEPSETKRAIWSAATELVIKLIRIDEHIKSYELNDNKPSI